jgi:hypothetical protein
MQRKAWERISLICTRNVSMQSLSNLRVLNYRVKIFNDLCFSIQITLNIADFDDKEKRR